MPRIYRPAGAGFCLLLMLLGPAFGAGDDPWAAGKQAYSEGDFELALAQFETARDTGLSGPAVHYNIAVCQFELGRLAAADRTFMLIAERFPRMRALAEYNRGLVAVEQGRDGDAHERFLTAYRRADDDTLRTLALTMLNRTSPTTVDPGIGVSGAWGASAGHDDNIVLRDDAGLPSGITTESSQVDAWGSLHAPITKLGGLYVDGDVYAVAYPEAGDFNQLAVDAGLGYRWSSGRSQFRTGFNVGHSTFGGDSYDNTLSGQALWRYVTPAAGTLELAAVYTDVSAGDVAFDGIEGDRKIIAGRYRWRHDAHGLDVALEWEDNSRADPGVSATRKRARLRYRFATGPHWSFYVGAEYRRSDYDKLTTPRTENRRTATLGIVRRVGSLWEVFTQARIADNDSSDPLYSYERNQIAVGVQRIF